MNEAVKPRFAVDLDEIERQLAEAQSAPAQPAPGGRADPLAELARIVGQDDPFQAILASDKARAARKEPTGLDDLFVAPPRPERVQPRIQPDLRGGYDPAGQGSEPQLYAEPASAYEAPAAYPSYSDPQAPEPQVHPQRSYEQAAYDQAGYDQAGYDQSYYHDDAGPDAAPYPAVDESDYQQAPKARSRKGLIMAGAVAGTVVLIGGGLMLSGRGPSILSSGEPPLITANTEPTKVQPQTPGGIEIPNQNKQIYERAAQDGQTKVANREEQPVDIREAARQASDNHGTAAGAPATTGGLNLGEPRRVRTVSIRPDGTVVGANPAPTPVARPAASAPATPPAPPAPAATAPAMPVQPPMGQAPAPAQPRAAASTPATPTTPAPRVATPNVAATPTVPAGGSSPQPASATPSQSTPQRVAAAQPAPVAPEPAAEQAGGFAVQLAVSASEAEARTTFGKLQQKYGDLNGQSALIRKAEVNGNTIYRVRVGPMARDEASSLCSKIQGQGGQCFVAKN